LIASLGASVCASTGTDTGASPGPVPTSSPSALVDAPPEAFTPATSQDKPKTFGRSFIITNSETGQLAAYRHYTATVDGRETTGQADVHGMVRIQAPSADSVIALHVRFKSPAGLVTDVKVNPMTADTFTTTTLAQEVSPEHAIAPVEITINDRAATREAIIRKVRSLGHGFVERSEWSARQPKKQLDDDWDYTMIALHHAGRSYACGGGAEQMLKTQKNHLKPEKYDDIAYHYGIDCSGNIYEGRDIRFKASSVRKFNTGVIGIVLLNDLTIPEEGNDWVTLARKTLKSVGIDTTNQIPAAQMDAALNMITALKSFFVIKHFGGHSEYPGQNEGEAKICPGRIGMKLVKNIRTKTQLMHPPKA
jgi:hypothetical protein